MPPDQIRGNGCETCDIDGLLPPRVAKRAEAIGVQKTRLDTVSLFALAVIAGSFIGFGAMLSTIVLAGAEGARSHPGRRGRGGAVHRNNLMGMARAGGKVKTREVLRAWALVYAGNFGGAAATALLVFLAGQYAHAGGGGGLAALTAAQSKVSFSFIENLVRWTQWIFLPSRRRPQ